MQFTEFSKIPRLSRECIITEKIDGTNASIFIEDRQALNYAEIDDPAMLWINKDVAGFVVAAASRTKWIHPLADNAGFAAFVLKNVEELVHTLGPGHHFGEWYGSKIQRGYGLKEKRFSLFNTSRWNEQNKPACCHVTPVLYQGLFTTGAVDDCLERLKRDGSAAAPGFDRPEGVVIFHVAGNLMFKKTLDNDAQPKSLAPRVALP